MRNLSILLLAALAGVALCLQATGAMSAQSPEQASEERISSEIQSGRIDAAISDARRAVTQFPRSSTFQQLLGAALFKKGLNGEARQAFRRSIELAPKVPQNYYNLALVELSEGQYNAAVKPLEDFVILEPGNAQAHLLLGRAYHNLNRTFPAIDQFKKALELQPDLPLAHYHLGYAYQSQGRLAAALAEYEREIKLNPRFYDTYWLAGNIELEKQNLDPAESYFRKGINLRPDAPQAHYGLARVMLARGDLAVAEEELKKVLEQKPDDVEAHYALARMYQEIGRKNEAAREFQIVADLHAHKASRSSGIAGNQMR